MKLFEGPNDEVWGLVDKDRNVALRFTQDEYEFILRTKDCVNACAGMSVPFFVEIDALKLQLAEAVELLKMSAELLWHFDKTVQANEITAFLTKQKGG